MAPGEAAAMTKQEREAARAARRAARAKACVTSHFQKLRAKGVPAKHAHSQAKKTCKA
jgi:hypothetical protein